MAGLLHGLRLDIELSFGEIQQLLKLWEIPPYAVLLGADSVSMQWLRANGSSLEIPIVDARSTERFHGEVEEPRKGLNRSRIPGSDQPSVYEFASK